MATCCDNHHGIPSAAAVANINHDIYANVQASKLDPTYDMESCSPQHSSAQRCTRSAKQLDISVLP